MAHMMMLRAAFFSQFGIAAFGLAATIAFNLALARIVGPQEFGLFGLAISVQHLVLVFQEGGFRTLLFRENARASEELAQNEQDILGQAVSHAVKASLVGLLLATAIFGLQGPTILFCVWAGIVGGFVKATSGFVSGALFGRGLFSQEALWQFWSRLAVLVVGTTAAFLVQRSSFVLWVVAALQAVLMLPRFHGIRLGARRLVSQRCFHLFTARMIGTALFTNIYFRSGPLLIYWLEKSTRDVAFYSVAHRLLDAALLMIGPAAQLVFFTDRRAAGSELGQWPTLIGSAWAVGLAALAAAAFMAPPSVLDPVLGSAYGPVMPIVGCFLVALIFAGPNSIMGQLLLARDSEHLLTLGAGLAAAVSVPANGIGIIYGGALGAAVALIVAEMFLFGFLGITLLRARQATTRALAGPL